MKFALLTALLFASLLCFAQTDSTETRFATATQATVITLSRADLERLPAASFLEVVAGAFPFLGIENIEEEFTYVVNGFVQINPNAINLSQLESISFYPGGSPLTGATLGKRGTFIISTKPTQNRFSVSTKTGLWSVRNDGFPSATLTGSGNGFFTMNEASLQRNTQKAFVSGAVSFLRDKSPEYSYTYTRTGSANSSRQFNRLRASAFGGYRFSKAAEIEGGLFYTLQPQKSQSSTKYGVGGNSTTDQSADDKTNYMSAHAGFRFTPSTRLTNFLTAEAMRTKDTLTTTTKYASSASPASLYEQRNGTRFTAFVFSDRLAWTPVNTSAINLQASLLARYRLYQYNLQYTATQSSGTNPTAFYSGTQKANSHSFSVSPSLTLCFNQWLSAQAGITYDDYQASPGKNTARKLLPDAGLKLDFSSLVNGSGLTALTLSSNYHQYVRNADRGDLLETNNRPSFSTSSYVTAYGSTDSAYTPRKNWTTDLTVALLHNRLAAKISYRVLERTLWAAVPISYAGGGPAYVYLFEPLGSKGWSTEIKAVVVEKETTKWTTQLVFYKEEYTRRLYGNGVYSQSLDPVAFDPGKAPWRGGFRTNLDVHCFFLQASLLLSFNESGTNDSGATVDDMTKYNANFLLAGYRFPLKGRMIKGLEANLQSRNLFNTKHDLTERYTGIGLSASF